MSGRERTGIGGRFMQEYADNTCIISLHLKNSFILREQNINFLNLITNIMLNFSFTK